MRSRTGCLTCRARKLKCDEHKPRCSQCRKGNRECQPSEGIVFRHQQNASMNSASNSDGDSTVIANSNATGTASEGQGGKLKGFYAYKNSFSKDSVWVDVPRNVIFVDNSDPYAQDMEMTLKESAAAVVTENANTQEQCEWDCAQNQNTHESEAGAGLEALSTAAVNDRFAFPEQQHQSMSAHAPTGSVSPFNPNVSTPTVSAGPSPDQARDTPFSVSLNTIHNSNTINFLLNPSHSISPPVDPDVQSSHNRRSPSFTAPARPSASRPAEGSNLQDETDFEVTFLLRHYAEWPGRWMDLFDLGTYFASYVPSRALANSLLKYAICAYSAKHLGRVKGAKVPGGTVRLKQSAMETWPDNEKVDWYWYGAKYYDKAIQLLMKELQRGEGPPPLSTPEAFWQWQAAELCEENENPRKRRRRYLDSRLSNGVHSDEVLAATAILCVYEFLDAAGPAWNRHLSGVKSLLDVAEVGMLPLEQRAFGDGTFAPKMGLSKARKAIFWNFARQDYLAAFINESHTRLNTDDLLLWTEAGLQLDSMGFVRPSNTSVSGYPEGEDVMKEDLISNALIWILSKIVNYISAGDNVHLDHDISPLGVSQQVLLERWHRLAAELDAWHAGLPDTFQPCARITPAHLSHHNPTPNEEGAVHIPEIWHCIPMCASTIQHYHMARILLLINKPHDSTSRRSTIATRLNSYRSIEAEIAHHAREILGISLSRPDSGVRIHALQPLFVAGQCLVSSWERELVVGLLREVEGDLGWATEYRVRQLGREWGWERDG